MARRTKITTPKVWFIRAGVGIAIGLLVGFASGAAAVRILQPPGVADADTTGADSTRKGRGTAAVPDTANAEPPAPVNGTVVPKLIGMEEGDARNAITRAGFTIGSVTFKASSEPLGTVVATFPVPGEAVVLPATVNLILSDGKPRPDSLEAPSAPSHNSSLLPNAS